MFRKLQGFQISLIYLVPRQTKISKSQSQLPLGKLIIPKTHPWEGLNHRAGSCCQFLSINRTA